MAYPFSALVPELRPYAEQLLNAASAAGLNPTVTSTVRTYAQQKALWDRYQAGRSKYPAAPPGASAHEYGWAFDMDVYPHDALADVGAYWQDLGGTWGGDRDPVHFELPGASEAARANYEAGLTAPAPEPKWVKAMAAAVDALIAFVPGIGEAEIIGQLLKWGFPNSQVADFTSGPFEYVFRAHYQS